MATHPSPPAPSSSAAPSSTPPTDAPTPAAGPSTAAPAGAQPDSPKVGGPEAAAQGTGPNVGASSPEAAASAAAEPPAPAAPSGQQRPRLLVRRFGALTGDEIPLQGERLVIGRFDPETGPVDVDLGSTPEAEHISRHHAELYRETEGRWFVRDLGSTNGVFVKSGGDASFGPRITEPRAVADGDELAFGNARFIFKTD